MMKLITVNVVAFALLLMFAAAGYGGTFKTENIEFEIGQCTTARADPTEQYGFKPREIFSAEKKSFKPETSVVFVMPLLILSIKKDLPVIFTTLWVRPDGRGEIHKYQAKIPKETSPEYYMRNPGIFIEDKRGNVKAVAPLSADAKLKFVSAPGHHKVVGVQVELDGKKFDLKQQCEAEYAIEN